ncbi:MAG: SDR family NAD(P)-dependent oxidoreductase [Verrucomicrobiales bacterium]|nr:SDR family NAD(P)-dependent oxidoreductase [Verrucomicrobiales bacterium]
MTASVNEAVQSIVQKAGPIQLLVNNAGYSFMGALEETSVDEARQQFETNLFGVLRVTNAILPGMRQQGFGRIVNIGLAVALMAGGSRPAMKDPRLQSPKVEIFQAQAADSNRRTFTGIVEARVQSDLGFRVRGKNPGTIREHGTASPERPGPHAA